MKTSRLQPGFIFLAMLAVSLSSSIQAATLSVTPSAIGNTHTGMITLQLGGLTNGETVVVERFVDANTNSVIDVSDLLNQSFRVTDGLASTIGGKTNLNVPGDFNVTNGVITTFLNYEKVNTTHIMGRYAFRLSSPTARFAPVTNIFNVTNTTYAQSITGQVRSNGTATAVAYATVILLKANTDGENFVGGVVANSLGNYTIQVPPGTYQVAAFKSNFVADFTVSPVTLGAGVMLTNNLNVIPATRTISGRVADAGNTNTPLPGCSMIWESTNGFVVFCSTDTNGNFNTPVTASSWKVRPPERDAALHGYAIGDSLRIDTVTNNVSGVNMLLPKGTALFYGSIKDDVGSPLPGFEVFGQKQQYESVGLSDASGNFAAVALAGDWHLQLSSDDPRLTNYVFSGNSSGNITLTNGQTIRQDFVLKPASNHITGFLRDNNNLPISGVKVFANATINGTNYQTADAISDESGNYSLNVPNGNWNVSVNCCGDCEDGLGSNYQCPNSQNVTISGGNGIVNFTISPNGPLQITTASLPDGQEGQSYFVNLNASGGQQPYTWTLASGALPAGLMVESWGMISGTPTAAGTFNFTVQVNDNGGNNATQNLSLIISSSSAHLSGRAVNSDGNPLANIYIFANGQTAGNSYTQTDANGNFNVGVSAGTWYLQMSGDEAQSLGVISPNLPFTVGDGTNITGINFVARFVTAQITGFVRATNSSPITNINVFGNATVNGTNYIAGGYTDSSGNYSIGVINGTWNVGVAGYELGQRGFDVPANQNVVINGGNGTANFTVFPLSPPQIITTNLPVGSISRNYHTNLQATGGQQPYNWSIISGSVPPGIDFNSGLLDGFPTSTGTFNFTVQISDQQGATNSKSLSLTINPALQISTVSLPNGTNGQTYSATLAASGGVPPYSWQIGGNLPTGLNLNTNTGAISGTPTSSGTITFTVLVNDSNSGNANTNLSITINSTGSNPAPYFLSFGKNALSGRFEMLVQGVTGRSYRFDGSTTLTTNSWTPLQTSSANPGDGKVYFQDNNSQSFNYRFYRAVLLP